MKKYYSRPPSVKAKKLADSYMSGELVTPCRLLLVLIISCLLIAGISVSVSQTKVQKTFPKEGKTLVDIPYKFDFNAALRTREEALELYRRPQNLWTVEKKSGLTLEEFWDVYDGKWPVVITDVVQHWPAFNWTKEFFIQKYGKQRVTFKAIVDGIQHVTGYVQPLENFISTLHQSNVNTWNYLEDEVFLLQRPELRKDIGEHIYASENFFSLFPFEIRPWDAAFLWGAKHSRSTLHMDPYNWTAISSVLSGVKKWKLFLPGQDHLLYVQKTSCGFPLECVKYNSPLDAFEPDLRLYPKFGWAQYLEVELLPGEMLIIPTGWFHQAYNAEETMAISSQMMNRNNYLVILEEIIKGGSVKRKKLPAHFNTLLPPDQVKLFLSCISKKVIKKGKDLTDTVLRMVSESPIS
uniref:F-box protein At1g78280-like isoform X1 n=1 Tax=Crassostrea virginica TaxID=6565 RepID=A0A8B8E640_CRAVI|nr:F-box protein At1g78280-like isoform X1 [Crassostrea virginica]XP_022335631.1 F-box protein At1g78280-like isoform X1 [Crassostrea virginica]